MCDVRLRQDMKSKGRLFGSLIIGASGLLLLYGFSFFHFVRSHEATMLRSYPGFSMPERVVAIPDTRMNRLRVALYAPMIKWFVRAGAIEWSKP